jgi:hypothetical protein
MPSPNCRTTVLHYHNTAGGARPNYRNTAGGARGRRGALSPLGAARRARRGHLAPHARALRLHRPRDGGCLCAAARQKRSQKRSQKWNRAKSRAQGAGLVLDAAASAGAQQQSPALPSTHHVRSTPHTRAPTPASQPELDARTSAADTNEARHGQQHTTPAEHLRSPRSSGAHHSRTHRRAH